MSTALADLFIFRALSQLSPGPVPLMYIVFTLLYRLLNERYCAIMFNWNLFVPGAMHSL